MGSFNDIDKMPDNLLSKRDFKTFLGQLQGFEPEPPVQPMEKEVFIPEYFSELMPERRKKIDPLNNPNHPLQPKQEHLTIPQAARSESRISVAGGKDLIERVSLHHHNNNNNNNVVNSDLWHQVDQRFNLNEDQISQLTKFYNDINKLISRVSP